MALARTAVQMGRVGWVVPSSTDSTSSWPWCEPWTEQCCWKGQCQLTDRLVWQHPARGVLWFTGIFSVLCVAPCKSVQLTLPVDEELVWLVSHNGTNSQTDLLQRGGWHLYELALVPRHGRRVPCPSLCDVKCVLQGHPNAGFQTWLVSKSCILALEANPRSYSPAPWLYESVGWTDPKFCQWASIHGKGQIQSAVRHSGCAKI